MIAVRAAARMAAMPKSSSSRARQALRLFGLDVARVVTSAANVPRYARDAVKYGASQRGQRFKLRLRNAVPMLTDFDDQAGAAFGQYFFQDLWAARKVFENRPERHLDVGSSLGGFVAHLLTFMEVDVVDIRPLDSEVPRLRFIQEDATQLRSIPDASLPSVSSLHAIEHFGLGRYGDPVDPMGWKKGMRALARVLAPAGTLYFSVPIGRERLAFNAQRVFLPDTVLDAFRDLELVSFAAVDDTGRFEAVARPESYADARSACGLFEFRRPAA